MRMPRNHRRKAKLKAQRIATNVALTLQQGQWMMYWPTPRHRNKMTPVRVLEYVTNGMARCEDRNGARFFVPRCHLHEPLVPIDAAQL